MKGSYTIEAAVIMSICFFMTAGIIGHAYQLYDETTGRMVLHKNIEKMRHLTSEERKKAQFSDENFNMNLSEQANHIIGKANGKRFHGQWSAEIDSGIFQPEGFLRKVEAAKQLEERNGSSL